MQSALCPAPSSFSQPLLDHTQFLQPWLNNQIITDVISQDSALVLPYVRVNYSVLNLTTGELYFKVQCNATVMFYQWNRISYSNLPPIGKGPYISASLANKKNVLQVARTSHRPHVQQPFHQTPWVDKLLLGDFHQDLIASFQVLDTLYYAIGPKSDLSGIF